MLAKKAVAYRFGSPSRRETTARPDRKANETLRNFPTEPETRTLKGSEKYSRLEKSIDQRYRSSLSRFVSSIEAGSLNGIWETSDSYAIFESSDCDLRGDRILFFW